MPGDAISVQALAPSVTSDMITTELRGALMSVTHLLPFSRAAHLQQLLFKGRLADLARGLLMDSGNGDPPFDVALLSELTDFGWGLAAEPDTPASWLSAPHSVDYPWHLYTSTADFMLDALAIVVARAQPGALSVMVARQIPSTDLERPIRTFHIEFNDTIRIGGLLRTAAQVYARTATLDLVDFSVETHWRHEHLPAHHQLLLEKSKVLWRRHGGSPA